MGSYYIKFKLKVSKVNEVGKLGKFVSRFVEIVEANF